MNTISKMTTMVVLSAATCIFGCADKREQTPEYIAYKQMMEKIPIGYGLSLAEQKDKLKKFKELSSVDQQKAMSELTDLFNKLKKDGIVK